MQSTADRMKIVGNALKQVVQLVRQSDANSSREMIRKITQQVEKFQPSDFGLSIPTRSTSTSINSGMIQYQEIYEEKDITIVIFILPPGAEIPLHNHPDMTVISQVLYGSMDIVSLDILPPSICAELMRKNSINQETYRIGSPARVQGTETVRAPHTSVLLPNFRNIHSFKAGLEQGCAILDILTPSYDPMQHRDCTYYQMMPNNVRTEDSTLVCLRPHPPPVEFRVVTAPYHGPNVDT